MGGISVIARRIPDDKIQFAWSGNVGMFRTVGALLLTHYDDPEMVKYLFSLGQLSFLWEPYSELNTRFILGTRPTGADCWIGDSEEDMFKKIAFTDYGYFYDEGTWYYVAPAPIRLKIPLRLVAENVDDRLWELGFIYKVEREVVRRIARLYHEDSDFHEYMNKTGYDDAAVKSMVSELLDGGDDTGGHPVLELYYCYRAVYDYLDPWALILPTEDGKSVGEVILRAKTEPRIETNRW